MRIFSGPVKRAACAATLAFIVAAWGAAPGSAASAVASPRFEPGACPSRVASSPAFAHAQCGQLIVPENRHKPNGKTTSLLGFLDVSSGFEEIGERCAEHVDDGDEGGGVSVAASAGSGGLEEPVQGLQACVGMG